MLKDVRSKVSNSHTNYQNFKMVFIVSKYTPEGWYYILTNYGRIVDEKEQLQMIPPGAPLTDEVIMYWETARDILTVFNEIDEINLWDQESYFNDDYGGSVSVLIFLHISFNKKIRTLTLPP